MDALTLYQKLFVQDGYAAVLISINDNVGDGGWIIQLIKDSRANNGEPYWQYLHFKSLCGLADETVELGRDEIYGFLKAKYPDRDWRQVIKEEVKIVVMRLFD